MATMRPNSVCSPNLGHHTSRLLGWFRCDAWRSYVTRDCMWRRMGSFFVVCASSINIVSRELRFSHEVS